MGARVSYLLAQQTLLLSFKRSSFQSHLDSHLQKTPPLLSINHPRLNGRFMQILILGTAPDLPQISPAPSLFLSPAFLRRSPFRQALPPPSQLSFHRGLVTRTQVLHRYRNFRLISVCKHKMFCRDVYLTFITWNH
jgi:hypothetical protein